jgi:HK97 gp10 family phage protein
MRNVVQASAKKVEGASKAAAKYDTGKLHDLIKAKRRRATKTFFKSTVGVSRGERVKGVKHAGRNDPNGAYYAGFVEFGTSKQPGKSFLRAPLEQLTPTLINDFEDSLNKEIEKALARFNKKRAAG